MHEDVRRGGGDALSFRAQEKVSWANFRTQILAKGRRSVIRVKFAVTIPRVGGQPGPVSKEGGGPPRVKAAAALRKERTRVKGSWKVTYGGYMP